MAINNLSPTKMAFMRLAKNKLAIVGGVFVSFIVILCVLGPYVFPTNAMDTRLWIGAKAPMFSHPDTGSEIMLEEGQSIKGINIKDGSLNIEWQKKSIDEIRVVLRRGKIKTIQSQQNSERLKELTIIPKIMRLRDGRKLSRLKLEIGKVPPNGLFKKGERVLIFTKETHQEKQNTIAIIKHGQVVFMDGIKKIRLRAEDIISVYVDNKPKTITHILGTDDLGRDLLQRIMMGGRVSLLVGIVATLVSLIIGVFYGAIAGYRGGMLDKLMMGTVDILYALPFIFLVLLLMVVFDRNIFMLFIALGMVQWLTMARIVRGQVLSLVQMDYIQAAKMSGSSSWQILLSHIIPHTIGPVIVFTTLMVPTVILEESFLAFIGLPVQYQGTTLDSWGSLVNQGMLALGESGQKYWLLVFPSLAMVMTLFGLNALGDGLRDAFDPKGKV